MLDKISPILSKGTRIVQADSGSDSNSESREQEWGNHSGKPSDSRLSGSPCWQRTFYAPTGANSRNLPASGGEIGANSLIRNLPALYAYPNAVIL